MLALFTAFMDKLYWRYTKKDSTYYFNVIYLVLLGLLFFVLRGDLMSGFAFSLAILFAFISVFYLIKRCILK